ncbi:MAG TPA: hypothetical protein VJ596_05360, partial [Gemmatimonadaceae bacterium]|nr:hypothetical protein [Gemmatimonadaceae bacterium]
MRRAVRGARSALRGAVLAFGALTLTASLSEADGSTRSPAHRAPRPAHRADSLTTTFTVSGLQVIHRRSTASDVVAVSLYLLGGTQQLTPETQGIEALMLAAS